MAPFLMLSKQEWWQAVHRKTRWEALSSLAFASEICLKPEEHSLQSRQDMLQKGKWPRKRNRQLLTEASSPEHSRAFPWKRYQASKRDRAAYFSQECIPSLNPLWEHLACINHWDPSAFGDLQLWKAASWGITAQLLIGTTRQQDIELKH